MDCMTDKQMKSNMKKMMGRKDSGFFGHMDVNNMLTHGKKKKKNIHPKYGDMSQYDDLGYVTKNKK